MEGVGRGGDAYDLEVPGFCYLPAITCYITFIPSWCSCPFKQSLEPLKIFGIQNTRWCSPLLAIFIHWLRGQVTFD